MKIRVLQENFTKALSIVRRDISSISIWSITNNVLLVTENSMLKMSTTDLTLTMSISIEADIDEHGAVAVPVRLLSDLAKALPNDKIDIETTENPIGISLKCGNSISRIRGTFADDFPSAPTVEDVVAAQIGPKVLCQAIDGTAFAAHNDDSHPVWSLNGVKVETKDKDFTFVATDGFRLAITKGNLTKQPKTNMDFIIPACTLTEISRLLGKADKPVEFMVTENNEHALFKIGDVELVTNLLDGDFPDYMKIVNLVPQSSTTKVTMNVSEFLNATRTASVFACDDVSIIRLYINSPEDSEEGIVTLITRDPGVGKYKDEVPAIVEGRNVNIAFNYKYLVDLLNVFDGDIEIEINSLTSPALFRPKQSKDYTHLITPISLQYFSRLE